MAPDASFDNRMYLCIDMKCFYASVECAERRLDPFNTCLVVADETRGEHALCLAVSPKMKALGVKSRCRLSDIPKGIEYTIAPPRMQLYIDYSADIYSIYLRYFSPDDIHVYSIDECFIDATRYLSPYNGDPKKLAKKLMDEIEMQLQIPSTAGIGTNLYLAKIALDISAKHAKDRMGFLDEALYRDELWLHEPLSDFWMISTGTVNRLARYGIHTMKGIADMPEPLAYSLFGKDARLLIDHAWGRESCLLEDIKKHRSKTHSVSFSQILMRDYASDEARIVMQEMVLHGSQELMRRRVVTSKICICIGYSRNTLPLAKGSVRLAVMTNINSLLQSAVLPLFDRIADSHTGIRRLAIVFCDVIGEEYEHYDLLTDLRSVEREKAREHAVLNITDRYGKNAILRGTSYLKGATQRERNEMIGGHRAGFDDERRPR